MGEEERKLFKDRRLNNLENEEIRALLLSLFGGDNEAKIEELINNSPLDERDKKIIEALVDGNNKMDEEELPTIEGEDDRGEKLDASDFYDFVVKKVKAIICLDKKLIEVLRNLKDLESKYGDAKVEASIERNSGEDRIVVYVIKENIGLKVIIKESRSGGYYYQIYKAKNTTFDWEDKWYIKEASCENLYEDLESRITHFLGE